MKIICTGKIANTTVGHIDHALAYAVGFKRLGHEVYVMDHVGSGRCIDSNNQKIPFEHWDGRIHFEKVMKAYGLWPRYCLIYKQGKSTHGLPYAEAIKAAKNCDLLITRSGQIHKVPEIFENARRRAFFDGNPGTTQLFFNQQGGEHQSLDRYDFLFTLGFNIGTKACPIPTNRHEWHPMTRPVVLPLWPCSGDSNRTRFTTISSWKGRTTFQWEGKQSGEKADNWLQFLDLPERTRQEFEIALRMDSGSQSDDRKLFQEKGWVLSDPSKLEDLDDYKRYIQQSRGEFSVAHNRYVEFSTGWFSDRSALYLASGKPVLVQSTGIESSLPTGKGLLTYRTLEEAVEGVEEINGNYLQHCRAAREIAEDYFDSDKVLSEVLDIVD